MMPMRILLLGASGPVTRAVVRFYARQGYAVRAATPTAKVRSQEQTFRPELLVGKIRYPERWRSVLERCDALLFLPPPHLTEGDLGRIYTSFAKLLSSTRHGRTRIPRIVMQSSLGARATSEYPHQRAMWQAEESVRNSGCQHVILRTGPIWDPDTGPDSSLVRFVRLWGRLPIMGDPDRLVQPVALSNLAEGFIKAVRIPYEAAATFDVAGPNLFRVRDWAQIVAHALGTPALKSWYVADRPVLRRVLSHARTLLPPWLVGCTCNPEDYYRTLCIRPVRIVPDHSPQTSSSSEPRTESTLN